MARMLSEVIRKDFAACDRATNQLYELLGLEGIEYENGRDIRPVIRGLLIQVIFEAGDRYRSAMERHLPGVSAIRAKALADAKRLWPHDHPSTYANRRTTEK